jgi:hypothetical protein
MAIQLLAIQLSLACSNVFCAVTDRTFEPERRSSASDRGFHSRNCHQDVRLFVLTQRQLSQNEKVPEGERNIPFAARPELAENAAIIARSPGIYR